MKSSDPRHTRIDCKRTNAKVHGRVCADCEVKIREKLMRDWNEMEKADYPDYATLKEVLRSMKRANKGQTWNNTAKHMSRARRELKLEAKATGLKISNKKLKQETLKKAKLLGFALANALQYGRLYLKGVDGVDKGVINALREASTPWRALISVFP